MRHHSRSILPAALIIVAGCASTASDVGPNDIDGTGEKNAAAAGLIYQLAGDSNHLYAISLNAGIWRRTPGDRWLQLRQSSPLATSLAVDPLNPAHLASGDRNGDASDRDPSRFDLTLAGVHESNDFGATWQLTFTPLTWLTAAGAPPACNGIQSLAIPAIAFTPVGTLLAGTPCGIARRPSGAPQFDLTNTPADVGLVTAFAVARIDQRTAHVWALARRLSTSRYVLLHSRTDGAQWDRVVDIPSFDAATGIGIPQGSGMPAPRGDEFSLAAFQSTALLVFAPLPARDNHAELLYFSLPDNHFFLQELDNANDGTGLGGRRLLRAFPLHPPFAVGNGTRIFLDAAQDLLEGTGIDLTGRISWKKVADAGDPVHSDYWDVLPNGDEGFWLATDGGVYRESDGLHSYNDGLATHHIHALTVLDDVSSVSSERREGAGTKLVYATSDDDAWFKSGPQPWKTYANNGDVNWVSGDRGNPALAMIVRHATYSNLTDFGNGAPPGSRHVGGGNTHIAMVCNKALDKDGNEICDGYGILPSEWQLVQSRRNETAPPLLDVVRLARLPLEIKDGDAVVNLSDGTLFTSLGAASSNPVLIRNRAYAANPDINESKYEGWELEESSLPVGVTRLWVVGGHGYYPAIYYVCVCDPPAGSPVHIFMQSQRHAAWSEVIPVVTESGVAKQLKPLPPGGQPVNGPLFVDQYNGRLALATDRGIAFYNPNGGWLLDKALTALLTDSGRDPRENGFSGGAGRDVIIATRALPMMFVSDVAFGVGNMQIAVASPYTGVFYRHDGEQPWLRAELGPLNTPVSTISFVGFNAVDLYIGSEGRGLRSTTNLDVARRAVYFEFDAARGIVGKAAPLGVRLLYSQGPIAGSPVEVLVFRKDGSGTNATITTLTDGQVPLGSLLQAGDRVFLEFKGQGKYAPAATAFRQ